MKIGSGGGGNNNVGRKALILVLMGGSNGLSKDGDGLEGVVDDDHDLVASL